MVIDSHAKGSAPLIPRHPVTEPGATVAARTRQKHGGEQAAGSRALVLRAGFGDPKALGFTCTPLVVQPGNGIRHGFL